MPTNTLTDEQVRFTHIVADLETERAHAVRAAREAVLLLTDALHALRNGSPEVTDEFIDRTITSLSKVGAR